MTLRNLRFKFRFFTPFSESDILYTVEEFKEDQMYKISTLNKISPVGLARLNDKYEISKDVDQAVGILLRSQNLHEMEFSNELLGIARAGAGVNNIPLDRCAENGIVVFNTPGANANAVKELVIAGMLIGARNLNYAMNWAAELSENVSKEVEKGKGQFAGSEIMGKTLGVIGLGSIGVLVANAAVNLGMNVVGYDPFFGVKSALSLSSCITVTDDLNVLLGQSDFVTMHMPATDKTAKMVNKKLFDKMKEGTILLNFSRDKLVDEEDLLSAIEAGKVAKYISDFPNDNTVGKDNIVLIPHLGASTKEAEDNCATMAVLQLMDYIENGNITNSVNFPSCNLGVIPAGKQRISILAKSDVETSSDEIVNLLKEASIKILNMSVQSNNHYKSILIDIENDNLTQNELDSIISHKNIVKIRLLKG